MNVKEIISLIPSDVIEELAIETNVNYYSKKLQGKIIFKLLLHCIISNKENSLRTIESAYESLAFKVLNKNNNYSSVRYNSISERLSVINVTYFEKLYLTCVNSYKNILEKDGGEIIRFDSTIVRLSTLLLDVGYNLGGDNKSVNQLKFTVGFSEIPEFVNFYTDKKYTSENVALKESIYEHNELENKKGKIQIFDRGINSRKTFDELTEKNISFVTRINANACYKQETPNLIKQPLTTKTLIIISDSWGYLYSAKGKSKQKIRRIEAITPLLVLSPTNFQITEYSLVKTHNEDKIRSF